MNKTKDQLIIELLELQQKYDTLKEASDKEVIEHEHAEEALRNSEEKFRLIAENTSDGILVIGADTKIQYVSPAYLKQIGYTEQEELSRDSESIYANIHPEDRDVLFANILKAIEQKRSELTYNYRVRHKNGQYIWREDNAKFNYNNDKTLINTYIICRDITQRKQIEQEILESEEKYRILFEKDTSVKLILDPETGRIIDANSSALEFYGYERSEIQEMNMSEINILSEDEMLKEMHDAVLENRNYFQFIHRKASGEKRNVEVYSTPIKVNGKEIMYSIIHDITESKQAKQALQESEHKLRTLFNAMKDIVFEMDYDGRYIFIAPTSDDLMIKPPEEVVGKTLHEVFPKQEADIYLEFVRKCLDENKMNTIEYPMLIDNKTVWFEGRAIPKTSNSVLYMATDITERKQAEEKLNASEEKFRSMAEQTSDLIALTDGAGMITYASSAAKEIFLITPEEMCGRNFIEFLGQADIPKAFEYFSKSIERGIRVKDLELKMKRKDGSLFFGELNASLFMVGTQNGTIVNIRDISERKHAEKKLKESEEKYRSLVTNLPVGVFRSTLEGKIVSANPAMIKIYGYDSFEELANVPAAAYYSDENPRVKMLADLKKDGYLLAYETLEKKKDGSLIWVSSNYKLAQNVYDETNYIDGVVNDITERKLAEEKLNASEEKFRSITEQTSDLIALTDSDGIITYASAAAKDIFYVNHEEMCGRNFIEFVDKQEIPRALAVFADVVNHNTGIRNIEFSMKRNDDSVFIGELNGSKFQQGKTIGMLVTIRDISERKQVEGKIREKDIQFRKLSANLPDLIFQLTRKPDGSYCVPIASEGIRNVFGCSPEDVMDDFTPIGRVIHPDDAVRVLNDIEYSAKHLSYFTCEFRIQIPGKEIQWILSRSTPEKLPDGSITWYGFNANITDLKWAEQEIEENREKYRGLSEATFESIFISEQGICIEQNLSAVKTFGYSNDEAIGRKGTDWIAPEYKQLVMSNMLAGYELPYEAIAIKNAATRLP
jgi:PAS domain S-box-containing protein